MTLLCERCFGPIDPDREPFYRLAHIAHADRSGRVAWNHATVHTEPCEPAVGATGQAAAEPGDQRRAA